VQYFIIKNICILAWQSSRPVKENAVAPHGHTHHSTAKVPKRTSRSLDYVSMLSSTLSLEPLSAVEVTVTPSITYAIGALCHKGLMAVFDRQPIVPTASTRGHKVEKYPDWMLEREPGG
jgi:hypothetical protein